MKGNNTLEFNEATCIEAMQEYLDKRMGNYAPNVVSVKLNMQGVVSVRVEERSTNTMTFTTLGAKP